MDDTKSLDVLLQGKTVEEYFSEKKKQAKIRFDTIYKNFLPPENNIHKTTSLSLHPFNNDIDFNKK